MKIVIDVGVIGLAQLFETARTGIYRVVSNLTLELLARENVDLSFSSLSSLQVNQLTVKYLEDRGFSGRDFPAGIVEKMLTGIGNVDLEVPQNSLATKVLSRLCRISRTRRIGLEADLYHSHYLPLPAFKLAPASIKS